ncbi:hypothetical protein Tco_0919903 [Tanacetum coccineum]
MEMRRTTLGGGAKGLTSPEQTATVEMVFSQPWTCAFLVAKGLTTPELMANCCQLDEQWFDLTKDTLRDALQITPVDNNNAFTSLPTTDVLIKLVNDLGYPKVVRTLSDVVTNDMGKKKATIIVILSVRFSKIIIHYLQSKHKFYPRPGSPLHLPNEESVMGYLKFSAKGTKREVFGMPIPNDLITDDIRGEQYYNAYLEKVAKHQRYLAGEEVSNFDSPAPKLSKATKHKETKNSKPSAPKAAPVTKPAVTKASKSQQTKSALAKPQEKKRKLVTEIFEAPSPAKQSKAGKNEPRLDDEEAKMQRAIEESLEEVYDAHRGPLPPVVIREPDFGKFQPLPETPKKKSPTNQFIFQRRTSTPTESSGHDESSSLYAELGLTDSESESDEDVSGIVASVQDEGQAGPNPGEHDEGQARPNPGDVAASQPPSSHVNLKLPTEGEVRLEEPASTAGTLSSLQNLDKELRFTNQFLAKKSQEDEPEKTNIEAEVQSMVTVPIHQDTSSIPLMNTLDIDLTVSQPVPTAVQALLLTLTVTVTATTTMTTTTPPIPPQPQ